MEYVNDAQGKTVIVESLAAAPAVAAELQPATAGGNAPAVSTPSVAPSAAIPAAAPLSKLARAIAYLRKFL